MDNGPDLFQLLQRLQNCPSEFLLPPVLDGAPKTYLGQIHTDAVINDLLFALGFEADGNEIYKSFRFTYTPANQNYLQLVLITSYLFYDSWFLSAGTYGRKVKKLLTEKISDLASIVEANQFVLDSERREELIRFCLKELNLKPSGETDAHANDRLMSVNSIERKRVIEESKAAQKRAQELREAIARQEAEEAASKWNRE
ncbi:MAG: hypothetical protein KBA66_24435 [Leptospiraceae bacterium]|nr:hypothetical protein [Leptospiraceae bacterium]